MAGIKDVVAWVRSQGSYIKEDDPNMRSWIRNYERATGQKVDSGTPPPARTTTQTQVRSLAAGDPSDSGNPNPIIAPSGTPGLYFDISGNLVADVRKDLSDPDNPIDLKKFMDFAAEKGSSVVQPRTMGNVVTGEQGPYDVEKHMADIEARSSDTVVQPPPATTETGTNSLGDAATDTTSTVDTQTREVYDPEQKKYVDRSKLTKPAVGPTGGKRSLSTQVSEELSGILTSRDYALPKETQDSIRSSASESLEHSYKPYLDYVSKDAQRRGVYEGDGNTAGQKYSVGELGRSLERMNANLSNTFAQQALDNRSRTMGQAIDVGQFDQTQDLAKARELGFYTDPGTGDVTVTLGGRQMNLQEGTQELSNALARANATGDFTDPETGETVETLQSKLAYAGQMGTLDGQRTIAGQTFDREYSEGGLRDRGLDIQQQEADRALAALHASIASNNRKDIGTAVMGMLELYSQGALSFLPGVVGGVVAGVGGAGAAGAAGAGVGVAASLGGSGAGAAAGAGAGAGAAGAGLSGAIGTAAFILGPLAAVGIGAWAAHTMATDSPTYTTPDGKEYKNFDSFQQALDGIYPTRVRITKESIDGHYGGNNNEALVAKLAELERLRRGTDTTAFQTNDYGNQWKLAREAIMRRTGVDPIPGLTKDLTDITRKTLNTQMRIMGLVA